MGTETRTLTLTSDNALWIRAMFHGRYFPPVPVVSSSVTRTTMLRQLCCSLTALVGCVTITAAQRAPGAAGTWNAKTMIGPKDSVVATYALTIAADGKSATIKFPNRDPIPTRVVAMAG